MKRTPLQLLTCWVLASVACGGEPEPTPAVDASTGPMCPSNSSAAVSDGGVVCQCNEGYIGDDCITCAPGYRALADGTCGAPDIDCIIDSNVCGQHGHCEHEGEVIITRQYCACDLGWTGNFCERCADGYQDNVGRYECNPTCATANLGCVSPFVCDDRSGLAVCTCPEGSTGDSCEHCALGYRRSAAGVCEPGCGLRAAELACVSPQLCVDGPNGPACGCREGYAGAACDSCAASYVDLGAGLCAPACDAAQSCEHGACLAPAGASYCDCEVGWAGPGCGQCARSHEGEQCENCAGAYHRIGDGLCVPACINNNTLCGANGYCADPVEAQCLCAAGYMGPDCDACAPGFVLDVPSGACAPDLPARFSYLGFMAFDKREHIAAVDPVAGEIIPIRTLPYPAPYGGIAVNPNNGTVYVSHEPRSVSVLNLITGALTPLATGLQASAYSELAYDTSRNVVYMTQGSAIAVINASDGSFVRRNLTPARFMAHLAYDPARDLIVGLSAPYSPDLEIFEINPTTFAATSRGILSPATVPFSGFAVASNGDRILDGYDPASAGFASLACETGVERMGWGVLLNPARTDDFFSGDMTVSSQQTSGDEVIGIYGTVSSMGTIQISTNNPDAYVCIYSYDAGALEIDISATARFKKLLIARLEPGFTLTIAPNRPLPSEPEVHAFLGDPIVPDPALLAMPQRVRVYTEDQARDRRFSCFDNCGVGDSDPADRLVRSRLMVLDRVGNAINTNHGFSGFQLTHSLARRVPF